MLEQKHLYDHAPGCANVIVAVLVLRPLTSDFRYGVFNMKIPIKQYLRLLYKYIRPQWSRVVLLTLLMVGSLAMQIGSPQILKRFIDLATKGGSLQALVHWALLFAGVALVNQFVAAYARYVGEDVGWTATNLLRLDLTEHCLGLDMSFHKAHTPGEMIERIDGDVNGLSNFFSRFVIGVVGNAGLFIGVLVMLMLENWQIGLALSLMSVASFYFLTRIEEVAVPKWRAVRHTNAELMGFIGEHLAGTEDIRANGAVPWVKGRFYELMRRLLATRLVGSLWGYSMWTSEVFAFTLLDAVGLAFAAYFWRVGAITIGSVYLIVHYMQLLERPLDQIRDQLTDLQRAGASISRIEELFATKTQIEDGEGLPLPKGPLAVAFNDVVFSYEEGQSVIKGLSFDLKPGQVLGLLGRTGSGKTTLARLLLRIHDTDSGEIRLGGVSIKDAAVTDLRKRVGLVTQDVQLFHGSVRDNLTFFNDSIPDKNITRVLGELGLTDWLDSLPSGLDTELAAGGGGLSAGEAQLLALGRLFLSNPDVVIMDEASSRLDPATEQRVEAAVERLLKDRTGIIIAHRLGTVQRADMIMILDSGRIIEMGNRRKLADDPESRFSQLLQTGMEEMLA